MCCGPSRIRRQDSEAGRSDGPPFLIRLLCQRHRRFQPYVVRRRADLYLELTRIGGPYLLLRAPVGKRRAIKLKNDDLPLSRLQLNAGKTLQLMRWPVDLRVSVMHVELDNFRAGARARVPNPDAYLDGLVA